MIIHAANNCFPEWLDYNKMAGIDGSHRYEMEFMIDIRDGTHPSTQGMPRQWER